MKKNLTKLATALVLITTAPAIFADNLLDIFNQALKSDPVFQQANQTRLEANIGIPIAFSVLMPQFNTNGFIQSNLASNQGGALQSGANSTGVNGTSTNVGATNSGMRGFGTEGYNLTLTQNVFNYTDWETWKAARASSKAANATYTAALQSLMSRATQAYLSVLQAQDDLRYIQAEKKAIYQQLDQVMQEYKVGLVAITSVYQAQAAYDSIISQEISAQNAVINQRENLRVITGIYYNDLDGLRNKIPLLAPSPADPSAWVKIAGELNWSILASRFNAQAAQENIFAQEGGHLPTVQAYATKSYVHANQSIVASRLNSTNDAAGIQLNLPVFQGGLVNAETKQASYQYQASLDQIEQTYRDVYNQTEQSYNNVVSGISTVRADSQAIVSNASSLRSTIEAFRVGTETMLDVLTAQKNLFDAERQFSFDEYSYLNATVSLKQAAGTLNYNDLVKINDMLVETKENYSSLNIQTIQQQAQQDYNQNIKQSNEIMSSTGGIVPVSPFNGPSGGASSPSTLPPATGMARPPAGASLPHANKPLPPIPTPTTKPGPTSTTVSKPIAVPPATTAPLSNQTIGKPPTTAPTSGTPTSPPSTNTPSATKATSTGSTTPTSAP